MYNQYFNFKEQPFSIVPDPHFIYLSERHQEGLAHLLFGIENGNGFVVLTGDVGTGKTTLCRCLIQQLPESIDLAFILNPRLDAIELLTNICEEFGLYVDSKQRSLKYLGDLLNRYLLKSFAQGRKSVVLIDEAQNLNFEVLEQIRLLTNLETNKYKLLQIILVGQPELKTLLAKPELMQLNQRITARYHLLPLSLNDTRAYIKHRLSKSNGNPALFKESAIRKVFEYSQGVPRLINILCDRALLGAYGNNENKITGKFITHAATETLNLIGNLYKKILAIAILLSCVILLMIFFRHKMNDETSTVLTEPTANEVNSETIITQDQETGEVDKAIEVMDQPDDAKTVSQISPFSMETLFPGSFLIYPKMSSDDVIWLRQRFEIIDGKKLESKNPAFYDEKLLRRVLKFQLKHGLKADGLVGNNTIIQIIKESLEKELMQKEHQ